MRQALSQVTPKQTQIRVNRTTLWIVPCLNRSLKNSTLAAVRIVRAFKPAFNWFCEEGLSPWGTSSKAANIATSM